MIYPFIVSAEIIPLSVSPHTRTEILKCERSPLWDEHFKSRNKYFDSLDAFCQATQMVVWHTRRAALFTKDSADWASETAHNVRKVVARAFISNVEIKEICEAPYDTKLGKFQEGIVAAAVA